jgi:pyruvate dehydrogenase kinase 2/3/4
VRDRLIRPAKTINGREAKMLSQNTKNPSIKTGQYRSEPEVNGSGNRVPSTRRYFVPSDEGDDWPPELNAYNKKFAETLEKIKRRHDSVVTTVGKVARFEAIVNLLRMKSTRRSRMETEATTDANR